MSKPKSGYIYLITDKINKKQYIGQTTRSIKQRFREHCCREHDLFNEHDCEIEMLAYVDQKDLDTLEFLYIQEYNTLYPNGYNKTKGGQSNFYHTKETKIKISKSHKGKSKNYDLSGENNGFFGKKHTKEVKKKMSERRKNKVCYANFSGRKHSEETKQKMRESKNGENHPMFGRKHSEETKQKMRENWQKRKLNQK